MRTKRTLVAHDANGEIMGSVSFGTISPLEAHQRQWTFDIAIAAKWQGQGVGRQLIEELCRLALEENIGKISLRVMATNPEAIKFYRRIGFQQEAHYKNEFWLNDHWVDDYQYALYLKHGENKESLDAFRQSNRI